MIAPDGVDLSEIARRVRYVGSVEHKRYPSFAGPPRPRADATLCDPSFQSAASITEVLRAGLADGRIGSPWEGDYPRYVWARIADDWYEGRLVNRVQGHYKGYKLDRDDVPGEWDE